MHEGQPRGRERGCVLTRVSVRDGACGAQVGRETVLDVVRNSFLATGVSDPNRDYWVYMIYIFLSANWDALLLLVATIFVRWRQLVRTLLPLAAVALARFLYLAATLVRPAHSDANAADRTACGMRLVDPRANRVAP